MRLIDADAVSAMTATCPEGMDIDSFIAGMGAVLDRVYEAPTVCCETCKHGIKGERIGGHEYFGCVKPYAEVRNYHTKDWFCGDWRDKDASD